MIKVPHYIKAALRKGLYRNNYRINVLNDDGSVDYTIDNRSLISDSVAIDERLCSGDVLKFGLCEGSSLEFQYFNHSNLYGRRLQVFIDVGYMNGQTLSTYTIPMGFFEVKKCSRQADTGIMKVTAYNKLQSTALDVNVADQVKDIVSEGVFGHPGSINMYMLLETLLKEDRVTPEPEEMIHQDFILTPIEHHNWAIALFTPFTRFPTGSYYVITTLTLKYTFQLNTIDDYYRLFIDTLFYKTYEFIRNIEGDYWIQPDEYSLPMRVQDAIQYLDNLGDNSLGDLFYGSVELVKAEDHTKTYFHQRFDGQSEPLIADYAGCYELIYTLPVHSIIGPSLPVVTFEQAVGFFNSFYFRVNFGTIDRLILSDADAFVIEETDIEDINEVTLRELQSAVYELECQYGQLNRETDLFKGIELNKGGLYPAETLYPSNSLYPSGASISGSKSMYSKLWADEGNVRKWRKLIITYKGLDDNNKPVEKTMEKMIDQDGTDDYLMSDNWLLKKLIWADEDVEDYADNMVSKMQDITWFPFEMWCAGLPYLETGDMIEIPLEDKHYTSYVLQRQLKGIQDLQDTYINGTLDIF